MKRFPCLEDGRRPQHTPWKAIGKILPYSVSEDLQSRNAVLQFVQRHYFAKKIEKVDPEDILNAAHELLTEGSEPPIEELVSSPPHHSANESAELCISMSRKISRKAITQV
jgi:hypothetical protein